MKDIIFGIIYLIIGFAWVWIALIWKKCENKNMTLLSGICAVLYFIMSILYFIKGASII